eukprot:CFRG4639T1
MPVQSTSSKLAEAWPIAAAVGVGVGALVAAKGFQIFYREIMKGFDMPDTEGIEAGGVAIAKVLKRHNISHIFVLSGGHISPVYVEAANLGIKVVDFRHESNAAFAADAFARLEGVGVACVTAGPGVTNTVTAVQNAMMAESPLIILGGATSTLLKGRGSLQDIDHLAIMKPITKKALTCTRVCDLTTTLEQAFKISLSGTPGPVFVECPMDLLWPAKIVLDELKAMLDTKSTSLTARATRWYVTRYVNHIYSGAIRKGDSAGEKTAILPPPAHSTPMEEAPYLNEVANLLVNSKRPLLVVGSGAMHTPEIFESLASKVLSMGIPTYLNGMARGLLGANPPPGVWYMHARKEALKEADVVVLLGVVCDFRLKYGMAIPYGTKLVTVNRENHAVNMNRTPAIGVLHDAGDFILQLSRKLHPSAQGDYSEWKSLLQKREAAKEKSIQANSKRIPDSLMNPVHLLQKVNTSLNDDSYIIVDGGDFVGTAAYTLRPRGPARWLDPGAFGTLGVGCGFAIASKLRRPDSEVWIIFGDGAMGFSITELDTMVRFKLGVIMIVGNDAGWTQMVRDQERLLKSSVACVLAPTRYDEVCEAYGGKGFLVEKHEDIESTIVAAKEAAAKGVPVVINCRIARNDFREGAISV